MDLHSPEIQTRVATAVFSGVATLITVTAFWQAQRKNQIRGAERDAILEHNMGEVKTRQEALDKDIKALDLRLSQTLEKILIQLGNLQGALDVFKSKN